MASENDEFDPELAATELKDTILFPAADPKKGNCAPKGDKEKKPAELVAKVEEPKLNKFDESLSFVVSDDSSFMFGFFSSHDIHFFSLALFMRAQVLHSH